MGLVRGMARTAVIAGTATAVSNRVSRRQARRWGGQEQYAEPEPTYAAPPPPPQVAAPRAREPARSQRSWSASATFANRGC